jgi:hypothetical protein
MTGARTVDGIDTQITALLATFGLTSFDGNDNLLFVPALPYWISMESVLVFTTWR